MTKKDIKEKICYIVADKMEENVEITENSDFAFDLGLDSLDMVEVFMDTETVFGINISKYEEDDIKTVSDLVRLVFSKTCGSSESEIQGKFDKFKEKTEKINNFQ